MEREIIVTWKTGEVENWGEMVGLYAETIEEAIKIVEEQVSSMFLIKSVKLGKKIK